MLFFKKKLIIFISCLFIILFIFFLTIPSEDDYYNWLKEEFNIKKVYSSDNFFNYTKDGVELFNRSCSDTRYGIFKTVEQKFEYINPGDLSGESFTVRSLGIGGEFFLIKRKNIIWKLFFQ